MAFPPHGCEILDSVRTVINHEGLDTAEIFVERGRLANRTPNRYMARNEDGVASVAGLVALPLFMSVRAAIRAIVSALFGPPVLSWQPGPHRPRQSRPVSGVNQP